MELQMARRKRGSVIKVVDSFDVSEIKEIVKEIEMKKCPFCGSDGEVVFYGPKYYMAGCSACAAEIHEHYFNPQDAVKAWNFRYTD